MKRLRSMSTSSELDHLLHQNSEAQKSLNLRRDQLNLRIRVLEHLRLSLSSYLDYQESKKASRSPISFKIRKSITEGNNDEDKNFTERQFFLNTHTPVSQRPGRITDPFGDAGLYHNPASVRAQICSIPPNADSIKMHCILSHYNVQWRGITTRNESCMDEQSRMETKLDSGLHTLTSSSGISYPLQLHEDLIPTKRKEAVAHFLHFMENKLRLREMTEWFWADTYTFREHLRSAYVCHILTNTRLTDSNILLKAYHIPNDLYMKKRLEIIRAQMVSQCEDSVLLSNDAVFFLKALQFNSWRQRCQECTEKDLRKIFFRAFLNKIGIFRKENSPEVEILVSSF